MTLKVSIIKAGNSFDMTVKLNIMVLFYMVLLRGPNKDLVACFLNSMEYVVAFVLDKLEITPDIHFFLFFRQRNSSKHHHRKHRENK